MTGSGTIGDPYIIQNVTDLQNVENDLAAYYELEGDIDASATTGWNAGAGFLPISDFTGQLDGKGYTISDLFINRSATYQALISTLDTGGVLQNIKMTGVDITSDKQGIGALVANMTDGIVTDCTSSGTVDMSTAATRDYIGGLIGYIASGTVTLCSSSCTVTSLGDDYAGGLIGYVAGGTISKCFATGNVVGGDDVNGGFAGFVGVATIDQCYATGAVSGDRLNGGFVGYSAGAGAITNCYARGTVTSSGQYGGGFAGFNDNGFTIDDCYSTGAVSAASSAGGFCGTNQAATITNCFWDTETSGQATSDGGTGKTTAQMKTKATFTDAGWNFITIWYITSSINDGYPAFEGEDIGHPNVSIQGFILG